MSCPDAQSSRSCPQVVMRVKEKKLKKEIA